MNKRFLSVTVFSIALPSVQAQDSQGGIVPAMLSQTQQSYQGTASNKALRNITGDDDIRGLMLNQENMQGMGTRFSIEVDSKSITGQKSPGRHWLFTGLNVMRAKALTYYGFRSFEFSEICPSFWDQLEKFDLFLQSTTNTAEKPLDDKTVEWLLKHPLGDGGTFTGVADIVSKYGLVPKCAMPETSSSENTARTANLVSLKLKEYALRLRGLAARGAKPAVLEREKTAMLGTVYRMLVLDLGVPSTEFGYARTDAQGNPVKTEHHTSMSFLERYGDKQLLISYVILMNDLNREHYKCYEIDYDRHHHNGKNWTYADLPVEDIKQVATASLKDSIMMYFSYDVGKLLNLECGLFDVKNYDYGSFMGTTLGMDKKQRIQTFSSGSSHIIAPMAMDLDRDGKPVRQMVEDSWGTNSGYKGHLTMTNSWFDKYMFHPVVEAKYVSAQIMELFRQKPVRLPAWDLMFTEEKGQWLMIDDLSVLIAVHSSRVR